MGSSHSSGPSSEEIADLKELTQFSGSEIKAWYKRFHQEYPSGVITRQDFIAMYRELFPDGDCMRLANTIFDAYDIEKNGVISFKEFMTTMSVSAKGTVDEKIEWAFGMYDKNGDGILSRQEVTDIIWSINKMRGIGDRQLAEDSALQLFISLDKDKTDKINKEEFIRGIKSSSKVMKILDKTDEDQ